MRMVVMNIYIYMKQYSFTKKYLGGGLGNIHVVFFLQTIEKNYFFIEQFNTSSLSSTS